MQKSLTIARLVGPVLAVIGSGILSNQLTYPEMPAQFLAGLPFIYFSGMLALVVGPHTLTSTMRGRLTGAALSQRSVGPLPVSAPSVSLRLSSPGPASSVAWASSSSCSAALSPSRVTWRERQRIFHVGP